MKQTAHMLHGVVANPTIAKFPPHKSCQWMIFCESSD